MQDLHLWHTQLPEMAGMEATRSFKAVDHPVLRGGKIGTTEYVDEYVPKPVHPPAPDHPKQFRYAHPRQTSYIHHYPWKCPAEHPYKYKRCPEKSLFKGMSIYTSDYTPPPNCPICPVAPFLSQKTTIDKLGHRVYD